MLKRFFICLLAISLLISPINAVSDVCPIQTPYIVYVTVPVPVTVTVFVTPTPTVPIQTQPQITQVVDPNLSDPIINLKSFEKYAEYIYGGLLLLLVIGVIIMVTKKRNSNQPNLKLHPPEKSFKFPKFPKIFKKRGSHISIQKTTQELNLFEEDEQQNADIKPIIQEELKPKKPKKPKSLLEQDFEF